MKTIIRMSHNFENTFLKNSLELLPLCTEFFKNVLQKSICQDMVSTIYTKVATWRDSSGKLFYKSFQKP